MGIKPEDVPRLMEEVRNAKAAVAAEPDFLFTGDQRHLLPLGKFRGARLVNAAAFLEALRE